MKKAILLILAFSLVIFFVSYVFMIDNILISRDGIVRRPYVLKDVTAFSGGGVVGETIEHLDYNGRLINYSFRFSFETVGSYTFILEVETENDVFPQFEKAFDFGTISIFKDGVKFGDTILIDYALVDFDNYNVPRLLNYQLNVDFITLLTSFSSWYEIFESDFPKIPIFEDNNDVLDYLKDILKIIQYPIDVVVYVFYWIRYIPIFYVEGVE